MHALEDALAHQTMHQDTFYPSHNNSSSGGGGSTSKKTIHRISLLVDCSGFTGEDENVDEPKPTNCANRENDNVIT